GLHLFRNADQHRRNPRPAGFTDSAHSGAGGDDSAGGAERHPLTRAGRLAWMAMRTSCGMLPQAGPHPAAAAPRECSLSPALWHFKELLSERKQSTEDFVPSDPWAGRWKSW